MAKSASVVQTEAIKSHSPINAVSIVLFVVVIILVGVIVAVVSSGGNMSPPHKEVVPAKAANAVQGDAKAIEEEANAAKRPPAPVAPSVTGSVGSPAQAGTQPLLGPNGQVVPPGLQRTDNTAALGDQDFEAKKVRAEQAAAAILSKAVLTDNTASAGGDPARAVADAAMAQLGLGGGPADPLAVAQQVIGNDPVVRAAQADGAAQTAMLSKLLQQFGGAGGAGAANPAHAMIPGQANNNARKVSSDREFLADNYQAQPPANPAVRGAPAPSAFVLGQGMLIPAVLTRAVNSDLPGRVSARVTTNVYDSITGKNLLIPAGSRLEGSYNNDVANGQTRILLAFNRLILPNGFSIDLPTSGASDATGASGLSANVNNHYIKRFTSAFLIAWIADRTAPPQSGSTTIIGGTSNQPVAQQVLGEMAKSDLERFKDIPPTLTRKAATRLNIEVVRDMQFPGAYGSY
jgi:type IV secretion system protein VirB10